MIVFVGYDFAMGMWDDVGTRSWIFDSCPKQMLEIPLFITMMGVSRNKRERHRQVVRTFLCGSRTKGLMLRKQKKFCEESTRCFSSTQYVN